MIRSVINMYAVDLKQGKKLYNDMVFDWPKIDEIIDEVYLSGGEIHLRVYLEDTANVQVYYPRDGLWVAAYPGRYILMVFPFSAGGERLPSRRWVKTIDDGQLETLTFNDDVFESKMVCRDIVIAKEIFNEFFNARKVTDEIVEKTSR